MAFRMIPHMTSHTVFHLCEVDFSDFSFQVFEIVSQMASRTIPHMMSHMACHLDEVYFSD